MGFKIFDSHVRDLYGRGQPQGTCVLLKVPSLDSLVHYFQSIHNDIFEVRGVQIENIQNRMVSQNSLNETINFNLSCAVALYSLCYSIMNHVITGVTTHPYLPLLTKAKRCVVNQV